MANQRLNATITIGGAVAGSLKSALGSTSSQLQKIGKTVTDLKNRQKELNNVVAEQERLGKGGSALKVGYAQAELASINKSIDALRRKSEWLRKEQELTRQIGDARAKFRDDMFGRAASAVALGATLRAPLKAFEDLDEAMNNMQVAMTNATGQVPKQFEAIKKQTVELGNILPGTTADFVNVATALKEQGVGIDSIVGGALKTASHLAVVMKMVPEQAAEMVAKLRESFQLSDNEFAKMADLAQRAKFGFGLKPDDLLLGSKYYGGKLNALGLTGAENVRKIFAIQGMAAQQGMDGSTFGTNFSMMLTRVGLLTERLNKNSKEMKAVNAELNKAGVHLDFFDKKGKFAGVDNLVMQLDKLKTFSQEKRLQILTRLFGEEGGRPADLISRNGIEGFKKALGQMDAEASLDRRIQIAISSFKNQGEALSGTFTNLLAAIGEPIANMFTPVMSQLNELIGGPMMTWVEQNKEVVKTVGLIVAGGAGLLGVGAAISGLGFLSTFAAGGLLSLVSIVTRLGGALQFVGATVLPMVGRAIVSLGAMAVANPIGAAITAIGLAALVIYKYWDPIKAWVTEFWGAISTTTSTTIESINAAISTGFAKAGAIFHSVWDPIRSWFKSLWDDMMATVTNAVEWIAQKLRSFGDAWNATKQAIGSGFGMLSSPGQASPQAAPKVGGTISQPAPASPQAAPGKSSALPPPPIPAMATARNSTSQSNTYNVTNQITQRAGESSDDLANRIVKKLKDQNDRDRRGRMFDTAMAGAY